MRVPVHFVRARVVRQLSLAVVALCALHVATGLLGSQLGRVRLVGGEVLVALFDLERGGNVPALFATLLTAACALLAALAARTSELELRTRPGWWLCSALFAGLALAEASGLQQSLWDWGRASFERGGSPLLVWSVPMGLGAFIVCGMLGRFLFNVEPATRSGMLLAGMLFVTGALGIEVLGSWFAKGSRLGAVQHGVLVLVEEGLEFAATIVLFGTLLRHLADDAVSVSVRFRDDGIATLRAEDIEPIGDVRLTPAPKSQEDAPLPRLSRRARRLRDAS